MPGRNFTDEQEKQIAQEYLNGKSANQIMRERGLKHKDSILGALQRQNISMKEIGTYNRFYTLDPHIFDAIDTEEKAYWLGFLFADGYIHREKTIVLALGEKDQNHVQKFLDFMKSDQSISIYPNSIGSRQFYRAEIQITHKHTGKRLIDLGMTPSRPDSSTIFSETLPPLLHHLVRGLFDGDGSARKSQSLVFLGSYDLVYNIREILIKKNIINPLKIIKHTKSEIYYLYCSGRRVALRVAEWMYKDATIWMDRKRTIIKGWPEPTPLLRDKLGRYLSPNVETTSGEGSE